MRKYKDQLSRTQQDKLIKNLRKTKISKKYFGHITIEVEEREYTKARIVITRLEPRPVTTIINYSSLPHALERYSNINRENVFNYV